MQKENQLLKSSLTSPLAGEDARRAGEGCKKEKTLLFPLIGFECLRTQNHFPLQGGSHTTMGFTLIELLVVVLIIGILAAVALPKYQLAVDKTKFTNLITVTQALSRGEGRLGLAGNTSPKFDEFDLEFPNCTVLSGGKKLSCNNGKWGCAMRASFPNYPRCSDINLKATYYIGADPSNNTRRICYAHTTDTTDRPNRLCQAVTKRKTPNITEAITIFSGDMQMNGYYFRN